MWRMRCRLGILHVSQLKRINFQVLFTQLQEVSSAQLREFSSDEDTIWKSGNKDAQSDLTADAPWPIFRRPVSETFLKSYASEATVFRPFILHGPCGVGKQTVIKEVLRSWRKGPHAVAFVNLSSSQEPTPWFSENYNERKSPGVDDSVGKDGSSDLETIRAKLEEGLQYLANRAIEKNCLSSEHVFSMLSEQYSIDGALQHFLQTCGTGSNDSEISFSFGNTKEMWIAALGRIRHQSVSESRGAEPSCQPQLLQPATGVGLHMYRKTKPQILARENASLSLVLAQELFKYYESLRNCSERTHAKVAADAAAAYPVFLVKLLSACVQEGKFQPKLMFNCFDSMRKATSGTCERLHGSHYHDIFLMQVLKLGQNFGIIPIVLVTSDSYYSVKLYEDFGDNEAFQFQEMMGWTPAEAAIHLVPAVFEDSEWKLISSVLGSNSRHLSELHSLWHQPSFFGVGASILKHFSLGRIIKVTSGNALEDCIDLYLGYLQVTAVDPAMEAATTILVTFASDLATGKTSSSRLRHGLPWRHPLRTHEKRHWWARLQLLDFLQALADADFAVNHEEGRAQEFLDDPSAEALLQVGLFYRQRKPPYFRPVTRAIGRCLVRWQVRERINLSWSEEIAYRWHRLIRGRYYRQLNVT